MAQLTFVYFMEKYLTKFALINVNVKDIVDTFYQ